MGQLVDTHLVFYILIEDQLLIWHDYRLNFEATTSRYFVLQKNQDTMELRECQNNLDQFLNPPNYFLVLTDNFPVNQSEGLVSKIFTLCEKQLENNGDLNQLTNAN